jgi:acyl-CoA reductase-like NAD-dependent aldehyde dehydrogenase
MAVHQNYINGAWAEAGEPAPNINPSNVSDVVGEYARANEVQVRAAIAAARAAFPAWSRGSIQARADMLDRIGNEILARKDELGILLSREEGKTKPEGIGEATRAG